MFSVLILQILLQLLFANSFYFNAFKFLNPINLKLHSIHENNLRNLDFELDQDINKLINHKTILQFVRNGHVFIPKVLDEFVVQDLYNSIQKTFSTQELDSYRHKAKVTLGLTKERCESLSLEECKTLLSVIEPTEIPFLQLFNVWRINSEARSIIFQSNIPKIAAELLGVESLRLYQDSVFIKRPNDGPTQWHSDLNMCPFDSNDFITVWIPLHYIPSQLNGGSSLSFASKSHSDFALPYWSDVESSDLTERYRIDSYDEYHPGDVTFHHGWCLHSSPGNFLNNSRWAYSVSFVADGVKLLNEEGHIRYPDDEDSQSYQDWIDAVGWGGLADHPLLPIVYSKDKRIEINNLSI